MKYKQDKQVHRLYREYSNDDDYDFPISSWGTFHSNIHQELDNRLDGGNVEFRTIAG